MADSKLIPRSATSSAKMISAPNAPDSSNGETKCSTVTINGPSMTALLTENNLIIPPPDLKSALNDD
jgi:hypothetical protein